MKKRNGVRKIRSIADIAELLGGRENLLFERCVYVVPCDGKDVVVVDVPRADRHDKPVMGQLVKHGYLRRIGAANGGHWELVDQIAP